MPLKTKISIVPERFKNALRDHNVKNSTTWREKMEELGRDEKGRIKPLVPKPDLDPFQTANNGQPESEPPAR